MKYGPLIGGRMVSLIILGKGMEITGVCGSYRSLQSIEQRKVALGQAVHIQYVGSGRPLPP